MLFRPTINLNLVELFSWLDLNQRLVLSKRGDLLGFRSKTARKNCHIVPNIASEFMNLETCVSYPAFSVLLRTVPTIVIAHTFCASQDTRISCGWCLLRLLIQRYFCAVQSYKEKAELSKCSWYPKRKWRVTVHFSEIIRLQFGWEHHTFLSNFKSFLQILLINYLRKMRGYP